MDLLTKNLSSKSMPISSKYDISLKNDIKAMIVKIFPKINYNNFYFKVIFNDWTNINSFENFYFYYYYNKKYAIFKYQSSNYFNKFENGIISVIVTNGDDNIYVNLYSEINDIHLENITNYEGNLINRSYRSFNYITGDIYINN